ncbi:perilipin-2 isoform X2 [Garra rufa]|uniref:perilipin-2 isoform X2 n=1 Tax=Garra rufa TaxID=137080 RepID=UPI003CCE969A
MTSEKKDTSEVLKEQNVFLRIRNLGSVSAVLESIEKTYIHTKQSHPILRSVCGMYEKGVSRSGNLAVRSIQPALHVLEPQLVSANSVACRVLDHLEEKVPALQCPPAELAAGMKKLMSSTLETAKDSVACPIKQTSNFVLDKRADRAISLMENLVDFVLPVSSSETEDDGSMGEQEPDVGASGPKPSFSRLGVLAGTICRRAFEKAAAQLQRSKRQGQGLVTQIPGVSPLVEYTMRTVKTIGNLMMANNEHEQLEDNGLPRLVSGLGQQLLKVYRSVVANVTKTHQTSFNLAEEGVSIVLRSFGSVRERALHNLSYYRLIPRRSSKPEGGSQLMEKDGSEECVSGFLVLESNVRDHMHNSQKQPLKATELKEISEETRLLKKKVMKQIPMQQKVVLGGSNKKVPNHRSQRTDCTQISSLASSYTRTVQNSRNASPTAE